MAIKDLTLIKKHLFLCNGESCRRLGAEDCTVAIRSAIAAYGLTEEIHTTKTLCNGRCKDGPIVISFPDGMWFRKMVKEHADEFVSKFLVKQIIPEDKVLYECGKHTIHTG